MKYQNEVVKNSATFGCASMTKASKIIIAVSSWMLTMSRCMHREENENNIMDFDDWYHNVIKKQDSFIGYMARNFSVTNGDYIVPKNRLEEVCKELLKYHNLL